MIRESLLTELEDSTRNYWIVPVSPTGYSNHSDFYLVRVQKGVNLQEIEFYCEMKEHEMIRYLKD